MNNYIENTNGIEVSVKPFFAEDLSQPSSNKYVFIYKIHIKNSSENKVQLISREWHVIESDGTSYDIEGEGVVGKQPVIDRGEEFEYASQAILFGDNGMMYGNYYFENLEDNSEIKVKIPAFPLEKESNSTQIS